MSNHDMYNIPKCKILGVELAAINMTWLIDFIKMNIKDLSGDYICVSNVHTTVMSYENEEYKNVQNSSLMAIPDGGPLSSIGRKRGHKNMQRVTGPDFLNEILKISEENGYTHYFYGSTDETLNKMKNIILDKYPNIKIAGMYSPPFKQLTDEEDREIVKNINACNADFVWVGLGAPKQENFMFNHKDKIHGLMIGVGAAFDYVAGNIKRAPKWMQKMNLEWSYRLAQEPKRLFGRYFKTNIKFIWNALIRGK